MRTVLIPLVALIVIIGVLYVVFLQFRPQAGAFGPGGSPVLIIYDVPATKAAAPSETMSAESLAQLLCHFEVDIDMVTTADYKKGMLGKASFAFYIGTKSGQPLTSYLLDDIYNSKTPFMWLGANLDRLQSRHSMDKFGIRLADDQDDHLTNDVLYKKQRLAKIDLRTFNVEVKQPGRVQVLAQARYVNDPIKPPEFGAEKMIGTPEKQSGTDLVAGMNMASGRKLMALPYEPPSADVTAVPPPPPPANITLPYILQSGDFWYVAGDPLAYTIEGGAYLAFADVLHDFLKEKHKETHTAFVRLEDIHAKREDVNLKKAADILYEKGIPFSFTLIPVYRNPETDETIFLSEDPQFQATLQYLISRGGTAILHGYTHQLSAETAVDYEFWSKQTDMPSANGDTAFIATRVEKALNECFLSNIYPLAWTTPHYAAGQTDYGVFANYFTTVVERRMPVELMGSDQFFPYVIVSDKHKQIILPEDLGYVNPEAGRDAKAILKDAEATKVVRDGWASFFFHTFLDLNQLVQIVDGLKQQGYRFASLTEFNNKVTTQGRVVVSGISEVKLSLKTQYMHQKTIGARGEELDQSYSFGMMTGNLNKYVSLRPGEIQVYEGVYKRPPITLTNLFLFRPTVSGITNPVALAMLILGMMTLVSFLGLWVYLVTRKSFSGARHWMAARKGEDT